MTRTRYHNGLIFDGATLSDRALVMQDDGVVGFDGPADQDIDLQGDIISPGFVDLQVNGGGGIMFNDAPTAETLARIAAAHRALGCAAILPTLITDSPEQTTAAINAAIMAIGSGIPGIAGLHLEGPHLSEARKGAHDADLIRPMTHNDLTELCVAARILPVLMITVAPENVTLRQVSALTKAGVIVSLGHTDADFDTCMAYADAGARGVTHLFNAMSQLGSRTPGLVGAALTHGELAAGLIADGIHVHAASMRAAFAAKSGQIMLVSDAMACAGSEIQSFTLNGRSIQRQDGRLTLADGTLAGADLALGTAIRILVQNVGVDLETALRAATSVPAGFAGLDLGRLAPGAPSQLIRIKSDLSAVTMVQ